MRYEAELIYVASHDMLAGSDTHLGGGGAGVCVCVCGSTTVDSWQKWMERVDSLTLGCSPEN